MPKIQIDLYSDTVTRPTPAMREFMAGAEVGDEQRREDPTVNRLAELGCDLLGKEDAIFLPSGTMCNQVAWRVHCQPSDEIIMDQTAHTRHFETAGPAALSGASIYPLPGERGVFTAAQLKTERVSLDKALGRTLAQPVLSRRDAPAFDRVAMDGYAVSEDALTGREVILRVTDCVHAGSRSLRHPGEGFAARNAPASPKIEVNDFIFIITQLKG